MLAGALLAAVAAGVTPEAAQGASAGPRIRIEPSGFDFGNAAQNKTLEKEFSIRNFGDSDLVIESISTTCGCTAGLLAEEHKVVKPGGTAPLRVKLETRNYRGKVVRSVMVRSNDAASELVELKVEVTVAGEAR
jgi:hypothetical protein